MLTMYSISPTTVQRYLKMASEDPLGIDALLRLEDPELNHRFNGGNPAYCDRRFEDFKTRIAYFEQELKKPNMTTYLLWEEYRREVPDGFANTTEGLLYIPFSDRPEFLDIINGKIYSGSDFLSILEVYIQTRDPSIASGGGSASASGHSWFLLSVSLLCTACILLIIYIKKYKFKQHL